MVQASVASDFANRDFRPRLEVRRLHVWALLIISIVGLARGLFWVVLIEVWYPVDEAHHYAYVESLARGDGVPVVGKDFVSNEILSIAKESPTRPYRAFPWQPTIDDPAWGVYLHQYEAVQGPIYYLLLVPVQWATRWMGILPSIFALRVASVFLAAAAVPLTWFLARELFPRRPAIWLLAPALLVLLQGFNANLAPVTNDAVVLPASAAVLFSCIRSLRTFSFRSAALTGLLLSVALLSKMTTLILVPMIVLAVLFLRSGGPGLSRRVGWGLVTAAVAAALLVPWLIRNQIHYGNLSGSNAISETTAEIQPRFPLNQQGMRDHFGQARAGWWQFQAYAHGPGVEYGKTLSLSLIISLLLGAVVSAARRRNDELRSMMWTAVALPVGFVTMLALVYLIFGGSGSFQGRHLYPVLPAVVVGMAAGVAVSLGDRIAVVLIAVVAAVALSREVGIDRGYVDLLYAGGIIGADIVPVVDQSYSNQYLPARGILFEPPCPAEKIGIGFSEAGPSELAVRGESSGVAVQIGKDDYITIYALEAPIANPFRVDLPEGSFVGASLQEREASIRFDDVPDDPLARIYCRSDNPRELRFQQRYRPLHPSLLTYGRALAWPEAWALIGRLAAGALILFLLLRMMIGKGRSIRPYPPADSRTSLNASSSASLLVLSSNRDSSQEKCTEIRSKRKIPVMNSVAGP